MKKSLFLMLGMSRLIIFPLCAMDEKNSSSAQKSNIIDTTESDDDMPQVVRLPYIRTLSTENEHAYQYDDSLEIPSIEQIGPSWVPVFNGYLLAPRFKQIVEMLCIVRERKDAFSVLVNACRADQAINKEGLTREDLVLLTNSLIVNGDKPYDDVRDLVKEHVTGDGEHMKISDDALFRLKLR